MKEIATNFNEDLYKDDTSASCNPEAWEFTKLKRSNKRWLNMGIIDHEIKMATFQLGAHKAPGLDGMLVGFFQRYWGHVGKIVINCVKEIFALGRSPENLNESNICLLPKQTRLEKITQFRPILPSNVIIKIVSKVIANRLKSVIGDLVGEEQADFIPGR